MLLWLYLGCRSILRGAMGVVCPVDFWPNLFWAKGFLRQNLKNSLYLKEIGESLKLPDRKQFGKISPYPHVLGST